MVSKRYGFEIWALASCMVVACSNNEEDKETVEIGLLLPYTGSFSENTVPIERGSLLALLDINAGGGVMGGKNLAFNSKDTESTPTVGAERAQDLLDEGVRVIQGALGSAVTGAVLQVTKPAGAVLMSGVSQETGLTATDNDGLFFRTSPKAVSSAALLANRVKEDGYTNVAVLQLNLGPTGGFTKALSLEFKAAFETLTCDGGPCTVVNTFEYNAPVADATMIADAVAETNGVSYDALLFASFPADGLGLIKAFVDDGYDETIYVSTAVVGGEPQLELTQAVWERLRWADAGPAATQGGQYFRDLWAANETVMDATPSAASSYDATIMYALAITEADTLTDGAAVAAALRKIANPPGEIVYAGEYAKAIELILDGQDIDYHGAAGSSDFDDFGDDAEQLVTMFKLDANGNEAVDP